VSNEYHFVTHWRVEGTCGEVADVLAEPLEFPRWWPSVYLDAQEREPAKAPARVGRRVALYTKGWLPYTLRWESVQTDSRYPHGYSLAASGDLTGTGSWTFTQNGPAVDITFDWRVRADKPLLNSLSVLLRPAFEANHRWAMRQGRESLELELARRRAVSDAARAEVPAPPGPTTLAGVSLLAIVAGAAAGVAYLAMRSGRRRRPRRLHINR